MSNANVNDRQIGGDHYRSRQTYQHWDFVYDTELPYMEAMVVKYLSRWRYKNGLEDLRKADHFLEKIIAQSSGLDRKTSLVFPMRPLFKYLTLNKIPSPDNELITAVCTALTVEDYQTARERLQDLIREEEAAHAKGRGYVDQNGGGDR